MFKNKNALCNYLLETYHGIEIPIDEDIIEMYFDTDKIINDHLHTALTFVFGNGAYLVFQGANRKNN